MRASSVAAKSPGLAALRRVPKPSLVMSGAVSGVTEIWCPVTLPRRDRVVREVYRKQIWKLNPETVRLGLASIAEIRRLQQEKEASNG